MIGLNSTFIPTEIKRFPSALPIEMNVRRMQVSNPLLTVPVILGLV